MNSIQGYVGTTPTMTPAAVILGMKAKFIDAMILDGWHYDDGRDGGLEFGENNTGFIHGFTQCFFGYDEAFKFWCAAKMQATPTPF